MADNFIPTGNGVMVPQNQATSGTDQNAQSQSPALGTTSSGKFSDSQLLDMWKRWKKESFDQRWIFERQWMRNIWYLLNRQWIYFDSKRGQWQDKRLAKWIPRPVTNILVEGVDAIRANFASINYGTNCRPVGEDNINVITAGVADDYAPILHEEYHMDAVMNESDFWMLSTGNVWLHTAVNYDRANGMASIPYETCLGCGTESKSDAIANNQQKCPACNQNQFQPATNPDGSPKVDQQPLPKGVCYPLSPFEIAFPLMYERYDLAPYTIRMRWRDKSYYEQKEELQQYAKTLSFSKQAQERTMQIFKTLPFQGDIGIAPPYFASGGANVDSEGIVEYDVWIKPCADFPDGQVIRIAGDSAPTIIHSESENLPGPLPYHAADGNPIFPFHHARYRQVGGRSLGAALIDTAIQKQDQLNQLDSHMLMTIGRMANPIWLEPKGAEVEKFTGEPGLVVKWNPLVAGGNAKPERIPGQGIDASVFQYRQMIKNEAEELMGTFDILKGQKPSGVEAYAALNFLDERAKGRHASAYKERGSMYKGWLSDALVIEQEFGPETRTRAVMAPTRGWAFQTFQKAQLKGSIDILIEDGTPKTLLAERASIDHLFQLQAIDMSDPDTKVEVYKKFGQSRLMPSVDAQVQEAWMNMQNFENFLNDPQAVAQAAQQAKIQQMQAEMYYAAGQQPPPVGPLRYKRWYNPQIHRNELIKWCLSDRGRKVFAQSPSAEQYVDSYLATIDMAIQEQQMGQLDPNGLPLPTPPAQQQPGGAGTAMQNSNRNAGGVGRSTSGAGATGPGSPQGGGAVQQAQQVRAMQTLNAQQ